MKKSAWFWALAPVTALMLLAGCSNPNIPGNHGAPLEEIFALPPFLSSPGMVLVTNDTAFSARVSFITNAAPGGTNRPKPQTGLILGRGTRMMFAPDPKNGRLARRRFGDETFFVWDPVDRKGFVANDTMQGYAPVSVPGLTAGGLESPEPGTVSANGYTCRKSKVSLAMSDGGTAEFVVWRAMDWRKFPVRIQPVDGSWTLDFDRIKWEAPAADAFLPPEGFARYDNADLMLSVMIERQRSIRKPLDEPEADLNNPDSASGSGRPSQPGQ